MAGYESIRGSGPQHLATHQDAQEPSGERAFLRWWSGGQDQPDREQQRRQPRTKLAIAALGILAALGVLLAVSGRTNTHSTSAQSTQREQNEDAMAAADIDIGSPSNHPRTAVSVFESSMYTGARLDQGFPAPAGLKEGCSQSGSESDAEDVGTICPGRGWGTVMIETEEKLQEIVGFGGAFTDAATINFYKLPKEVQDKVMDAYFGSNGIEYSVGRIPMNSCDFSVEQYCFADVPGDYNLTHFDEGIEKDTEQRIPMIHEALKRHEKLKLFISPWSPPAWMKAPKYGQQSMIESATPYGLLSDPRVHAAWALYFSKFITAYEEQGIDVWGLTIQNESENPGPWEACVYTPESQANFIRDYLGPVIRRDHPDVKIMAFDHNRDHLLSWAQAMVEDEETAKYVDGMAFHWYFGGMQRELDGSVGWGSLNRTRHVLGDEKFMLSTESCNCPNVAESLADGWKRAEHVAHDMIADVNTWSAGWIDWNLMLNHEGGPNHSGNLCDSPVISNEDHSDVTFQPMFFFLGHMSKFAQPGARRLKSHVTGRFQQGGMVESGARPGFEATVYGCEGSVRQSWELTATGEISLADYYGAQNDWYKALCISRTISPVTQSVYLVPCDSDQAGIFVLDPDTSQLRLEGKAAYPPDAYPPVIPGAGSGPGEGEQVGALTITSLSSDSKILESDLCLAVLDSSTEDSAVLTLSICGDDEEEHPSPESQEWSFEQVQGGAGEGIFVWGASGQCMTAGWPFFTGAAFEMSEESKERYGNDYAVVLLNTAEEPVEFDLSFPSDGYTVRAMIGPRSIQTILA